MLIIHRSKPTGNFTILPNELLRDDRLSYCARGVLAELLSRPNGWETNADALWERARRHRGGRGEGRRAMRAALAELEDAGYMVRHKRKGEKGRFVTVLELYDVPQDRGTACGTSAGGTSVNGTSASGTSSGSTDARSTDEEDLSTNTLSPAVPAPRAEPEPVHERETPAFPSKPSTAQQLVRAAGLVDSSEEEAFITWAASYYRIRSSALWRTVAANGDLADWVTAWRAQDAVGGAQPLPGTDTAVSGWLALARQLDEPQRGRGHTPYSDDPWKRIEQQAAAGERPGGWASVPHCGRPDCDEITRVSGSGDTRALCSYCHPALQF
ncbi:hypothetical protein ACFZB5_13710 [Streptomyces nodosus]|uniref:hypothetical protein n=1 Tax=Streptomyces nodosus TaxID=40318 RepID=UPI0036E5ADD9